MNHELIFSLAGLMAMAGWAALLLSPLIPVWSDRIAGLFVPGILSAGYVAILVGFSAPGGGFGSFAEVSARSSRTPMPSMSASRTTSPFMRRSAGESSGR
jgi:hypothetical protein